ncbi:MAG: methionyl-tRNA formyltransferase [Actinomycetes bacterium]|jgi:methionyl-tRNA formyltransferase
MTSIVFFGTPEEAVPTLTELAARFDVRLVITPPDRPRGRSKRPQPPPVKVEAERLGIPVEQPEKSAQIAETLTRHGPFDLGVVVAYGRILRPEVLDAPAHGILNLHFSLLPRWRGAAPVARALMAGDTMTGVTIIRLDEGLDTGPVLTAQLVDIHPAEDAGALTDRLARLGARLLASVIPGYVAGAILPVPQSDDGVTYAEKITAADRPLDGIADPAEFLGRVRGLAPDPGAVLVIDGEPHKVLAARADGDAPPAGTWELRDGFPVVPVGDNGVVLVTLQPPGGKPMPGDAWARGRRRTGGSVGAAP